MSAREPCGGVDPVLGRLPGAVAHALFHGDDWLSGADRCITAALDAATPNTRIAWACDWTVFRTWALGRATVWYPDERDRIRLPIRQEVLSLVSSKIPRRQRNKEARKQRSKEAGKLGREDVKCAGTR